MASRRALLSVSDKTGITDFATKLSNLGWEIISTGGTAKALSAAGIAVTTVEEVTQFPECFGGRVKTMHPMIMGGVLFRRDNPDDVAQAKKLKIEPIDLVVVNLYPFAATVADKSKTDTEITEQIDIGGPTLLRSAAKNHAHVTVVTDPTDYDAVMQELQSNGATSPDLRKSLATKVFLHTAAYDAAITEWLSEGKNSGVLLTNGTTLRYGENPHQWGKYFTKAARQQGSAAGSSWGAKHQGKELSYLNILDADAAWEAVCAFGDPTAVFVKHANPSGIACRNSIDDAFQAAYDADRLSAFGVIIAINRPCSATIAQKIIDQKMFVEVIVAPEYEPSALELLKQKPNIRVIEQVMSGHRSAISYRSVLGGMLVQDVDTRVVKDVDLKVASKKQPTADQVADLLFAWNSVKYCKSNAIVFAKDLTTVGLGTGQTSRVDATWIAAKRAGEKSKGAVMASDAFFPFPDSVEEAARHGIAAIIQPGGSVRDAEVFAKADELGIVMVLTGVRAFRH
jgi:phosphoribosylaminoimidazolecarboxamide formyltransferase/IMP cyclohydrolase